MYKTFFFYLTYIGVFHTVRW